MMDDRLAAYWSEFLSECLAVLGTFALVTYTLPWLSLAFIPLVLFFVSRVEPTELRHQYISAAFYRQTSRELKRLDSILRSHIYSSFGEQVRITTGSR
jgi:ATP-binding cassette subfamily C (CFTR/MRP) protein 1